MFCGCNNVIPKIIIGVLILFIILLVIAVINNSNNQITPNILVATAQSGDNTTTGTTSI